MHTAVSKMRTTIGYAILDVNMRLKLKQSMPQEQRT